MNPSQIFRQYTALLLACSAEVERRRAGMGWFPRLECGHMAAYCKGRAEGGATDTERREWGKLAKVVEQCERLVDRSHNLQRARLDMLAAHDLSGIRAWREEVARFAELLPSLEFQLGVAAGTRSDWTYWAGPGELMTVQEVERIFGANDAKAWRAELAWRASGKPGVVTTGNVQCAS